MANRYSLRYLPIAVEDLVSIFDWIAGGSPANAADYIKKIDERIHHLQAHPFLARIPRDDKLKAFGYRVLVIESYLAFYLIRGKMIEIHRVIHGSRDLNEII